VPIAQSAINSLKHSDQVTIDVAVPKPQDVKTIFRELFVTTHVVRSMRLEIMLTAIDLDDKPVFHTNEINDVSRAWRLASEVVSARLPRAQVKPQFYFLPRHCLTKVPGDLICHAFPTRPPSAATLPLRGRD